MNTRHILYVAVLGMLVTEPSIATDLFVDCSQVPDGLNAAVAEVQADQQPTNTISLGAGTCHLSPHNLDGAISVYIIGAGPGTVIVPTGIGSGPLLVVGASNAGTTLGISSLQLNNATQGVIQIIGSTLNLADVQFSGNTGTTGAVVNATNSTVDVRRTQFLNGTANDGGAIANFGATALAGSLNIVDSTFSGNNVTGNAGAILSGVQVQIDRSSFFGNTANGHGGALFGAQGSCTVRNSTFYGNAAFVGGAIQVDSPQQSLTLLNVTIYNNLAALTGDAIDAPLGPTLSISNSLISGSCANLTVATTGHNNIESPFNTCMLAAGTNSVSVPQASLMLLPLSNNGGPTLTLMPAAGSALIDQGGNDCEPTDQRGYLRNVGPCDVGAVEAGAVVPDKIFADGFE